MRRQDDLNRIHEALEAARDAVLHFTPGQAEVRRRGQPADPVSAPGHAVEQVLRDVLARGGEGWLSRDTVDEPSRVARDRVWVVDALNGTNEFVEGIAEWCVSVGLVEEGRVVAGGVLNPGSGAEVLGGAGLGVTLNGEPVRLRRLNGPVGATVLASRSELRQGHWEPFANAPFCIRPCGSTAYRLALVAAGKADATWTMIPRNEWQVAAGVALVQAAGGKAVQFDGTWRRFNQAEPRLPNLVAANGDLVRRLREGWLARAS